jgi:hypothetical protein
MNCTIVQHVYTLKHTNRKVAELVETVSLDVAIDVLGNVGIDIRLASRCN